MKGTIEDVSGTSHAQNARQGQTALMFGPPILAAFALWQWGDFSVNRDLPVFASLAYWASLAALTGLFSASAGGILARLDCARPWLYRAGAVLANALVIALTIIGLKHFFGLDIGAGHGFARTIGLALLPATFGIGLWLYLHPAPVRNEPEDIRPARLARMPSDLKGEVIAMRADDHYIHVQTRSGRAMIKHRFSDAVSELEAHGTQVHKSWWVNFGAIARIEREGRNMVVRLHDGTRVPVSRSRAGTVRFPDA